MQNKSLITRKMLPINFKQSKSQISRKNCIKSISYIKNRTVNKILKTKKKF